MSDPKYDVFLSFRGEDTREKFTSHLYAELDRQNIRTFIDYRIETGDKIQRALIEAIEESLIYVVILSEHYASSHWCLDELLKIQECKKKYGREVIPLFYEVDPKDVKKQTGSYGKDFLEHHEPRERKDKIDAWKAALTEVAELKGLESKKISPENTFVEEIAKDILKKLNRPVSSGYYEGLTGMDKHIKELESRLQLETVRIIGIWGMGGIGKTTIADAIFEKLATKFSSKSIIRNVQQEIERFGLSHVKKEYLSQLLNETITSSESNFYYQRLKRTKGLLVFDDLKDADQLQDLIGTHHKFGQGSRIIVTSSDKQVLKNTIVDESKIYEFRDIDSQLESWLQLETVHRIGIWGMGGIGKTTIANAVFDKLATQFDSRSMVNVQQEIKQHGEVSKVKSKFLSQLLGEKIKSSKSNFSFHPRLRNMKVLLILDDLSCQLDELIETRIQENIETQSNFGEGSRIIVTSRDRQVLKNAVVDEKKIYDVNEMDDKDSLQLFCLFAFKQNNPKEPFVSLTKKFLDYVKGLPLAHEVIGKLLYGRTKKYWESQLQTLAKSPDRKVFDVLKLSYDGLDHEQKVIFLDIACFHRGELKTFLEQRLDNFGFSVCKGMADLKDRCLISISEGRVQMHDLIQDMGHEIVRLENKTDPEKRSRLWKAEDICDVLSKNKGTNAIQCIMLDMNEIKNVQLQADTFEKMEYLRMIYFYGHWWREEANETSNGFLKSFPDHLQLLLWNEFPQRSLPQDFCPKNLVTLEMPTSRLEQLWEGEKPEDKALPNLKRLNLVDSENLVRVPDLSLFPNIEELNLSGCVSLIQVYSRGCTELKSLTIPSNILSRSSGFVTLSGCSKLETLSISGGADVIESNIWSDFYLLDQIMYGGMSFNLNDEDEIWDSFEDTGVASINELCWLDISNCESLTSLPAELFNSKILTRLCLSGCLKLEELPEINETMENLKVLTLDGCIKLKTIPSSIGNLSKLVELDLAYCESLETLPSSIFKLKLKKLNFDGCSMLKTFTEILEPAKSCVHINLTEATIKEPPSPLQLLVELEEYNLKLFKLDFTDCASLESFPSSIFKLKLKELNFEGCLMLQTFPEILEPAESFTCINLTETAIKELPSSLHHLVGLEKLSLRGCTKLKTIPSSIGNLSKLFDLDLSFCESLETFPGSIFKLKLTELDFIGCSMLSTFPEIPNDGACLSSLIKLSLEESSIVNLPESLAHLSSLKSLNLSDCKLLECVPKLPPNLNQVLAYDCPSIKRMMLSSRSDFEKGTFKFHLTNSEELDAISLSNIKEEAYIKINDDAYESVFFCSPGSTVPNWFSHRCQGHSITIRNDNLYLDEGNKLIGFALCVVLGPDFPYRFDPCFRYELKFESDGQTRFHPNKFELKYDWKRRNTGIVQDHTFLWKYDNYHFPRIGAETIITFEILDKDRRPLSFPTTKAVKECGICPLFRKEPSGDAMSSMDPSSSDNYTQNKRRRK